MEGRTRWQPSSKHLEFRFGTSSLKPLPREPQDIAPATRALFSAVGEGSLTHGRG